MNTQAASTALRRASKAFAHATRMLAVAETESARKRHARRAANASRAMGEARRTFEAMAFETAD